MKLPCAILAMVLALSAPIVFAQAGGQSVAVSANDIAHAMARPSSRYKLFPSQVAGRLPSAPLFQHTKDRNSPNLAPTAAAVAAADAAAATLGLTLSPTTVLYYPADLKFLDGHNGVASLTSATQHVVALNYSNCPACWASDSIRNLPSAITQYLTDLNASTDITVTNQYTHSTMSRRYPPGSTWWNVNWSVPASITDTDVQSAIHAVITAAGGVSAAGPGHVYHLFLPPGQDVCMSPGVCYSPDNPNTFYFCGYHGAVVFNDVGPVFYSVQPYAPVDGCQTSTQNPLSAQVSVLGHEITEAITDPYPGYGWVATNIMGEEIGDLCAWNMYTRKIGSNTYTTQLEYSNAAHACKNAP